MRGNPKVAAGLAPLERGCSPLPDGQGSQRRHPSGFQPSHRAFQADFQTGASFTMKFLFDLLPVLLFFIAFKLAGQSPDTAAAWLSGWLGDVTPAESPILLATVTVILATALQVGYLYWRHGRVEKMPLLGLALIVIMGGLTLFLKDDTFIKWKPSLLYWAFAVSMAGAALFRKNAMRLMLAGQLREMPVPDTVWRRLNGATILFFAVMGLLNLLVAYSFSTETWVNFKLFGGVGLLLLFAVGQMLYLGRYLGEAAPPASSEH
jgi:intracellular septation protein